uniref:SFRICE_012471 n=1 Tax=Spodoptera frugiperda TaxID=7108 RepID=A0A2H1VDZ1_SPOFR
MPPTETTVEGTGMLCLSRHDNCPWSEALKSAEVDWTGIQYTCLKILHLYCKVFEKEDVLDMVIRAYFVLEN